MALKYCLLKTERNNMTIVEKQNRLRAIATDLKAGSLTAEDKDFICGALFRIADGEDAKTALDVKPKRGERSSIESHEAQRISSLKTRFALGFIKAAMEPIIDVDDRLSVQEGGLGLTLDEAIGLIGEIGLFSFSLTEETLKTYWRKHPELQNLEMHLPD
jgi:hypothetical protein